MIEPDFSYAQDEQIVLSNNLPKMEDNDLKTTKWINIMKRIGICLDNNRKPDSPGGQLIAEYILLLSQETFNSNPSLAEKFWKIRKSEKLSASLKLYPIRKEVIEFIDQSITHFEK